jgi:hypothetical protein
MRTTRALVTTALSAGTLTLGALLAPAAGASTAGATTVVLNPELLPVLVETLKVAPIAPGQLSAPGGVAQVSFPITEVDDEEIEHEGGLRFSPLGGGTLRITDFEIELQEGVVDAETRLKGKDLGQVDIFALGDPQPINGEIPSCDGIQAGLTLTPEAAGALGAPEFAGAFVGDACVVPEG